MFNAVGLLKMQVISPDQFMNYAHTGKFTAAAKADIKLVSDDGVTTVFADGVPIRRVQTGNMGEEPQTDEDRFDLSIKLLEDFFVDEKGKAQPGLARRAVRKIDRAGDVLANAFNEGNKIPMDQNFANDFEEGMSMVRRYEDPRWITNPTRWFDGREMNDRAGLLGYIGVRMGLTGGDDFNDFGYQYGVEFGTFADSKRLNEEFRTDTIIKMEQKHQETGASREDILEATLEQLQRDLDAASGR